MIHLYLLYLSQVKLFCLLLLTGTICLFSCRKDHGPRFSVGQEYGGGIVFYIDQTGQHGWIAAKEDLPMAPWGQDLQYFVTTNAASTMDGFGNTAKIIAAYGDTIYAAKSCHDYTGGGFNDWYLPAIDQLDTLYRRSRSDLISLSLRHDYIYWSSTESTAFDAWFLDFGTGYKFDITLAGVYFPDKVMNGFIRPIRSF